MVRETNRSDMRQADRPSQAPLGGALRWLQRSRIYRRTLRSLSALSDGELKELGLSRGMIRPVARQAAQAA